MLKHIRAAIKQAGLSLSQVEYQSRDGHIVLILNHHKIICSSSPRDRDTATKRIARELSRAQRSTAWPP